MSSEDYTPPQLTVKPYPPGASGMRSASIANNNNSATQQNDLNKIGGRRRRKFKGGATATITVPVVPNPVPVTGSGDNTVSANVTNSTKVGATENANSQYDSLVGTKAIKTGGKKRSTFKGGRHNHVHWGCMSGGKSRRKKGSRRKMRKSRRRR